MHVSDRFQIDAQSISVIIIWQTSIIGSHAVINIRGSDFLCTALSTVRLTASCLTGSHILRHRKSMISVNFTLTFEVSPFTINFRLVTGLTTQSKS